MFNVNLADVREPEAYSAEFEEQENELKILASVDAQRVEYLVNEFHFTEERAFIEVFQKVLK